MNKENKPKNEMSVYLSHLKYKASDFSDILKSYVTNMRLVALVLLFVILGGLVSFFSVARTLNPEINIAMVAVSTVLPGATPTDMESLITKKLENEIKKVDDIDVISSTSRESVSVIMIQFKDGVDRDDAQTDVQNAVGAVSDLPDDAQSPRVKALNFEDVPVSRYAVIANDTDQASLNSFIESFKTDLENENLIDRVEISGNETQEVQVLISQEKLQELNVNLQSLLPLITSATSSYPAGTVYSDKSEIGLTIDRDSMTLDDLRSTVISVDGVLYRLGDIAEVSERSAPGYVPAFITKPDGTEYRAITIDTYRILGSKISEATEQTEATIEKYEKIANGSISFIKVSDINNDINKSFSDLYSNLFMTVCLVFIVLFLFVGVRQAFLAAISVPLVFMTAFIVMYTIGMSLNFLSIFALLISLGLLVDVTIVVISAITTYYRSGKFSPKETGLLVWKDFFTTLLVTTLTTVWAFLPLLLAGGMMGAFLKPLPIVVSSVLLGSVFIGFFIILPLMVWLLDFSMPKRVLNLIKLIGFIFVLFISFSFIQKILNDIQLEFSKWWWILIILIILILTIILLILFISLGRVIKNIFNYFKNLIANKFSISKNKDESHDGIIDISFIERLYKKALNKILLKRKHRRSIVWLVILFFIFSISLIGFGFVKNEFFPKEDANMVYVSMELPLDTRASVAEDISLNFVSQINDISGLSNIQTQIGAKIDGDGNLNLGLDASNVLLTVNLVDVDDREITSSEVAKSLRENNAVKNFINGKIVVVESAGGPPAGADVTIKLTGDDLEQLNVYVEQVKSHLKEKDGVINVRKSVESGSVKIVFIPNKSAMMEYGVSLQEIGFYLRTFGSGMVVSGDIDFDDLSDSRDIVLRLSDDVQSVDALERTVIQTNRGEQIPLTTLGKFKLKESPAQIKREDLKRVLSVTAAVEEGYNATQINEEVSEFMEIGMQLADGYSWQSGGANEENNKSVQSILKAMLLAFVLIFLTLIIQLNSYRKSFIVLLVIPLAISGVFVLFAIFGLPLSFPALIGVLALFGIVINNSIMIIDQINKNHKEDMSFHQAVVDGSSSRLEPILLSSLTTIVGLLPITITQPVWQGLGGAIISGLSFSGIIMLFFIPAVYYMIFENDKDF